VSSVKVAVTDLASLIVTSQAPVPLQAPDQPLKVEPEPAFWLSVTLVPWLNGAERVPGHLIPAGELSTSPLPVPLIVTLSTSVFQREGRGHRFAFAHRPFAGAAAAAGPRPAAEGRAGAGFLAQRHFGPVVKRSRAGAGAFDPRGRAFNFAGPRAVDGHAEHVG